MKWVKFGSWCVCVPTHKTEVIAGPVGDALNGDAPTKNLPKVRTTLASGRFLVLAKVIFSLSLSLSLYCYSRESHTLLL